MSFDITPEILEEMIYDKLEYLESIRKDLAKLRKRLKVLNGIIDSQTRRQKYWTKEQREVLDVIGIIETSEILEKELMKGIDALYSDLRQMGG